MTPTIRYFRPYQGSDTPEEAGPISEAWVPLEEYRALEEKIFKLGRSYDELHALRESEKW